MATAARLPGTVGDGTVHVSFSGLNEESVKTGATRIYLGEFEKPVSAVKIESNALGPHCSFTASLENSRIVFEREVVYLNPSFEEEKRTFRRECSISGLRDKFFPRTSDFGPEKLRLEAISPPELRLEREEEETIAQFRLAQLEGEEPTRTPDLQEKLVQLSQKIADFNAERLADFEPVQPLPQGIRVNIQDIGESTKVELVHRNRRIRVPKETESDLKGTYVCSFEVQKGDTIAVTTQVQHSSYSWDSTNLKLECVTLTNTTNHLVRDFEEIIKEQSKPPLKGYMKMGPQQVLRLKYIRPIPYYPSGTDQETVIEYAKKQEALKESQLDQATKKRITEIFERAVTSEEDLQASLQSELKDQTQEKQTEILGYAKKWLAFRALEKKVAEVKRKIEESQYEVTHGRLEVLKPVVIHLRPLT